MKFWRLVWTLLLFGALYEGSREEGAVRVPTLQAASYNSEMEESYLAVCRQLVQMPCELPVFQIKLGPEYNTGTRSVVLRLQKLLRMDVGVRARGSWAAPIAESHHLTFLAEPTPVEWLRVLCRLRI